MKARLISYWVTTVLLCAMMTMSAVMYLSRNPKMMSAFASLGYPAYFPILLGTAKLLGVIALLAPGYATLKEWAYAGFAFTFISALVSHLTMGQTSEAIGPIIAGVLLAVSYLMRPGSRRLSAPATV